MNKKKVITYDTFDLLRRGHINLLRRAKELGYYLIVGLSIDEYNQIKEKKSYFNYEKRRLMLESIRYVDQVIPEKCREQKVIDVHKLNIIKGLKDDSNKTTTQRLLKKREAKL